MTSLQLTSWEMANPREKARSGFLGSLEFMWASVQASSHLLSNSALSGLWLQCWKMCLGLQSPWACKPVLEETLLSISLGERPSSSLISFWAPFPSVQGTLDTVESREFQMAPGVCDHRDS